MSIETSQLDFIYVGDGDATQFPTPFYALDTDIAVVWRPLLVGGPIVLALGVDYTLSGRGVKTGGTCTVINSLYIPSPSAGTLLVLSNVPPTQLREFPRSGVIDNRNYEASVDKLTIEIQQILRDMKRSIHAPVSDLAGDMQLTLDYLRAGGFLGFDDHGRPLVYSLTALVDLLGPLLNGDFKIKTLPKSREELGLQGDGATDDSVKLVQAMRADSANGGATYFLQPQPGKTFYFRWGIAVPNNINLVFSGLGVSLSANAFIRIEGFPALDIAHRAGLAADAVAGQTQLFIDVGPLGGGAVSDYYAVGDRVAIICERDGADNAEGSGEYTIVAVDSASFTILFGLVTDALVVYPDSDYTANWGAQNRTEIYKLITANLTVDAVIGDNSVTVNPAAAGQFQAGDWVQLEDDKQGFQEIAGGNAQAIHVEQFQVTATSADTITFERRIERVYETAYTARLVRMNLIDGSSVSGCAATFTQPPTQGAATFGMTRALDCLISSCQVLNEDAYGSIGPMFLGFQAVNCTFLAPLGRNHKTLGTPGVGRGLQLMQSTGCSAVEADISGCRLNFEFDCATHCHLTEAQSENDAAVGIGFAGNGEVGCTVSLRSLTGGSLVAPGVSGKRAVRFGNGLVGPYRCVVREGRIAQYKGANVVACEFVAGAEECRMLSPMDDITTALWCQDSTKNPSATSRKCAIESTVNGYDGWLVYADSFLAGSAVKTIGDLHIQLRAYDGSTQIFLRQIAGCRVRVEIDCTTPDATNPFAITAVNVDRLQIFRSDFIGAMSGISMQDCFGAYVVKCILADFQGSTIILRDGGGNTGMVWASNDVLGFTGTVDVPGTPSTGGSNIVPVLIS